jgi:hypothetical protein
VLRERQFERSITKRADTIHRIVGSSGSKAICVPQVSSSVSDTSVDSASPEVKSIQHTR